MPLRPSAFVVLAAMTVTHAAFAQPMNATCEDKRAAIAQEIEAAEAHGQTRRVRGLQTALRESEAHCSDAKLQKELDARIARQEKKVAQDQRDLDEARAQGKPAKISQREARLAREQAALERLRSGGH